MIEKNIGNVERLARLLFAAVFMAWAVSRPALNAVEWFVMAISVALFLNGIFSRCYLWYVLEVDTCQDDLKGCYTDPRC